MHIGVRILRICYDTARAVCWTIDVVARFEKGHQSMVYCCDFRQEDGPGEYTVVSTSFYDKKICTWSFLDPVKRRMSEEMKILRESGSWEVLEDDGEFDDKYEHDDGMGQGGWAMEGELMVKF